MAQAFHPALKQVIPSIPNPRQYQIALLSGPTKKDVNCGDVEARHRELWAISFVSTVIFADSST